VVSSIGSIVLLGNGVLHGFRVELTEVSELREVVKERFSVEVEETIILDDITDHWVENGFVFSVEFNYAAEEFVSRAIAHTFFGVVVAT